MGETIQGDAIRGGCYPRPLRNILDEGENHRAMTKTIQEQSFGGLLKAFRKRHGWTQQQTASAIGVHRNAIGRWERGDFLPESKALVLELARVLRLADQEMHQLLEASFLKPTPPWNVPYQHNPFFTGRQQSLLLLHQHLKTDRIIALTQSYAIHGLGGIGKTQLAVEYAYTHTHEYSAILWVRAETQETISSSWLEIAELLQLPERHESEQQRVIAAVWDWLSHHTGWLLIWDNLEDVELLPRSLPACQQGTILITTRRQTLGTLAQSFELPTMTQEEGLLFLLRRARLLEIDADSQHVQQFAQRQPTDYAAAQQLVLMMGGLPLALDQAGAYLEETGCGLVRYVRLYEQAHKRLLERRGLRATEHQHPESIAATLALAYQQVEQTNPLAAELLYFCAFLHPDAIPEELLTTRVAASGAEQQDVGSIADQRDQAIAVLRTFSLVQQSLENQVLSVHRLVQVVLKERLEPQLMSDWIEHTVQALHTVFPTGKMDIEVESWPQCQRYLAHVEVCASLLAQWNLSSAEAGRLLQQAGVYLRERGQYEQAKSLMVQALQIREQVLETEHLDVADTLNELAIIYWHQSIYEQAEPLFLRALQIQEHHLGSEHMTIAESLNNLAMLYERQSKYKEAESLHLRALRIWEHHLGSEHLNVGAGLNNLAMLYEKLGRYKESESLHLRALRILEQHLGPEHLNVAAGLNNLAKSYVGQEKFQEAEPFYLRALQILDQHFKSEHPNVALVLNNLAHLYMRQERYEEAEPLYSRALPIWEQHLGPEHPYVAIVLCNLAQLYTHQQRYEEAEPLGVRALAIHEQRLKTQHPELATSLRTLGEFYLAVKRYEEAEPLLLRALAIYEQVLGAEHAHAASSLLALGTLYTAQQRWEQASTALKRALSIQELLLGANHAQTNKTRLLLLSLSEHQDTVTAEQIQEA